MLYAYLWLKTWLNQEEGQDLIEYVLIVGLVAIVAIAGITLAGNSIDAIWTAVADQLDTIASGF
jgi:Flp pilus assembly pilin Flp